MVKGKSPVIIQKDFHGQQEDSPWLTKIVQPTDHFCPAEYDSWDKLTVWADSFPKIDFFNSYLPVHELEQFFLQGFPRELDVNILKHVLTHLYKHIGERNWLAFMFISITFPNYSRLYETMEA